MAGYVWIVGSGLLLATLATPCEAELNVVVTSKPIHSLAAGVMAGVGSPHLLVTGNASPHTYALKPSDAKALNGAQVVFRVSEQLEPFTAKVVSTLPASVRVVSLAEAPGIERLDMREGGTFESHDHKHAHGAGNAAEDESDPHVWLDPTNARRIVAYIADVLAQASLNDAARFRSNAAELEQRLGQLSTELAGALKPVAAKPFVVLHDSLQYLEARYGLTAVGSITVKPDQQPSARRIAELRRKVGELSAVCVFGEPQFPDKLISSVTEGTAAKTAVIDPEGGLISPGPDLYFELMRKTAAAIRGCLAR